MNIHEWSVNVKWHNKINDHSCQFMKSTFKNIHERHELYEYSWTKCSSVVLNIYSESLCSRMQAITSDKCYSSSMFITAQDKKYWKSFSANNFFTTVNWFYCKIFLVMFNLTSLWSFCKLANVLAEQSVFTCIQITQHWGLIPIYIPNHTKPKSLTNKTLVWTLAKSVNEKGTTWTLH